MHIYRLTIIESVWYMYVYCYVLRQDNIMLI